MKGTLIRVAVLMAILALIASPASAGSQFARSDAEAASPAAVYEPTDSPDQASEPKISHRLIVELERPALVQWAQRSSAIMSVGGKPDLNSPQARNYIDRIRADQNAFVQEMKRVVPAANVATYVNETGQNVQLAYQVLFNGVTVDSGVDPRNVEPEKVIAVRDRLKNLKGVKAVYFDYAHEPDLYASIPLINAPTLWNQLGGHENAGAGVKVASMDGGVHKDAPMFSGEGFDYPPGFPKGHVENTNGKIIASRVYFRSWDPPAPGDENPWPGENGTSHGVHTSGIAVGNPVEANFLGVTVPITGVAPAAWVMSYRVFYNSITGDGSFYTAEGLAALEDIVRDGADVVNNSWGGGPGSLGGALDPLDQALINASEAGVFVSMSNGNAGPGLGTSDHPSGDYINAAATTTTGTFSAGQIAVTGPEPVPPGLDDIPFGTAEFGEPLPLGEVITYTYRTSTDVDPANVEGCDPFPAGAFEGRAALVIRGNCDFSLKVYNAQQAGAEFAVIYNHASGGDEVINMAAGEHAEDVTIGSVFIGNTHGDAMVDFESTATEAPVMTLNMLAQQIGRDPDVVIDFSSRGPGVGYTLKPDIAAPGVNILSQGYTPGAVGEARHLGFGQVSGTSMAAPHVTGAAALLRQLHPDWSNAYIKSALMTTSKYIGVFTHDGAHALPLDMGAGRLDLTNAADPGVILDEPSLSFGLLTVGDVISMTVNVTSIADQAETYTLSTVLPQATGFTVTSTDPIPGFSVTPAELTLGPGETGEVTVTLDTSALAPGDHQGYVVLEGENYEAHFPVWGRVAPEPTAQVLIIDNDASSSVGFDDYLTYYTDALDTLGITYDVWDADANFGEPTTIPHAAVLSSYEAIILFTGDNFYPDGTFTVSTALTFLDQDRLTEYANGGGIIIAMGQDLSWVMDAENSFFYGYVLGGERLQDTLTDEAVPTLPILPYSGAPQAFQSVYLDVTGAGDGAGNQGYMDELNTNPVNAPDNPEEARPYTALFTYPSADKVQNGVVGMAHRAQPSLENPGVSYLGRSIYTSFGLEGVNDDTGFTTRAELLDLFLAWAMDEPTVTISDTTTTNGGQITMLEATLTSNIAGTDGVSYRWDFGDGTPYSPVYNSPVVSHKYETCGTYTVRVEVTDTWGNVAIGTQEITATHCEDLEAPIELYLPLIFKAPEAAPEPTSNP